MYLSTVHLYIFSTTYTSFFTNQKKKIEMAISMKNGKTAITVLRDIEGSNSSHTTTEENLLANSLMNIFKFWMQLHFIFKPKKLHDLVQLLENGSISAPFSLLSKQSIIAESVIYVYHIIICVGSLREVWVHNYLIKSWQN